MNLQKALAMATTSNIATKGIEAKEAPTVLSISLNGTSVPLMVVPNGGIRNGGKPAVTLPVILKGCVPSRLKM